MGEGGGSCFLALPKLRRQAYERNDSEKNIYKRLRQHVNTLSRHRTYSTGQSGCACALYPINEHPSFTHAVKSDIVHVSSYRVTHLRLIIAHQQRSAYEISNCSTHKLNGLNLLE